MSDLIRCAKCGKQTSKFFPVCEYCSEPLGHGAVGPEHLPEGKKIAAGDSAAETPGERGKAIYAGLEKYSDRIKKCPFCAEEIQLEAIKCRYCGELLKRPGDGIKRYKALFLTLLAGAGAFAILSLAFMNAGNILKGSGTVRYDNNLSPSLKSDPVKADYVKKYITITNIGTIEETDLKSSAVTKYLCGTIKNSGDRTVIKLTLAVYYFDKNGRCIGKGEMSPILGTKDRPNSVKPYGSNDFKLLVMSADSEWHGRIKTKVSDIELL